MLATLFSAFTMNGADLSRYHEFRIGSDVATVLRSAGSDVAHLKVLHQRPTLIQELEWRPDRSELSSEFDAVRLVVFSFTGGELFRMFVDYDRNKTEGLSADDLVESISTVYGVPTKPVATIETGTQSDYAYGRREAVLARWQDADYSLSLIQSSQQARFGLIITSRSMDQVAQKAIIEGARLDVLAAPQIERDRARKAAADERAKQEEAKLVNKPAFKP
jgi:hypothetical protein